MFVVGRREGKKQFVRCRHGWADNIKMDLKEIGRRACTGLIWLVIEKSCVLLCCLVFHQMRGIS